MNLEDNFVSLNDYALIDSFYRFEYCLDYLIKHLGLIYLTRQWQIRTRFGRTGPATPCRWPGKRAEAATLQAKKALW